MDLSLQAENTQSRIRAIEFALTTHHATAHNWGETPD